MSSHTRPTQGRYFHISCMAKMMPNPLGGFTLPPVPWVERPGVTYVRRRPARHKTETNQPRTFKW